MNDVLYDKFCYYNDTLNPLNAELNPICHLLALLGAHHILHISRIRVNWDYCLWAFSQYLWIKFKFLLKYVMYALMDCIFGVDHFS